MEYTLSGIYPLSPSHSAARSRNTATDKQRSYPHTFNPLTYFAHTDESRIEENAALRIEDGQMFKQRSCSDNNCSFDLGKVIKNMPVTAHTRTATGFWSGLKVS